MSMPENLVFVRHGRSEGNEVVERSKKGDDSAYPENWYTTPGHQWRLTPLGVQQARTAGKWIQENISQHFNVYYVSPYVRTRETAAHLNMRDAYWVINRALRERDWGDIGSIPRKEFRVKYPDNFNMKTIDPLYWTPPGGESIAHVAENRVRNFLDTLHRERSEQDVLVVTHGDYIEACRLVLEYKNDDEFLAMDRDKSQMIHNCEVVHYTRRDPRDHSLSHRISWVRRAHPVFDEEAQQWGMTVGQWEPIEKSFYTNESLLASIESVPYLLEH